MILASARWKLALGGAALFTAGIATAWLLLRPDRGDTAAPAMQHQTGTVSGPSNPAAAGAIVIEIPADVVTRAGLVESEVVSARLPSTTRIPGTIEPNAYAVVAITAPAGGRVLRVFPQLGDRVSAGTPVTVIQSPELAKAATDQSAAVAALSAVQRDLERTRKLVEIGAASRRELEEREADRASAQARVDAARAEVRLLGGSGNRSGEMTVRAASAGVVTERAVNPGVVVEAGAALVTTASLSPVWVIGDLAEPDMGRVRVGDRVSIHAEAYPGLQIGGRITYIAPEVRRETRTAQIRVEAPNEGGRLRFGMLVEARIETVGEGETLAVPTSAIQRVGSRTVVYVVDTGSRSRFEERAVETGNEHEGMTQIRSGLRARERVISTGSFFLRAEADRQGLRPSMPTAASPPPQPAPSSQRDPTPAATRVIAIGVDAAGFSPSRVSLRQGETVALRFTRIAEGCASEVLIPEIELRRTLPLKQPVDIRFTASRTGEFAFTCGMNMLRGTLVVQ